MSVCVKESRLPLNRYGSPLQGSFSQVLGSFLTHTTTLPREIPPFTNKKITTQFLLFLFKSNSTHASSSAPRGLQGRTASISKTTNVPRALSRVCFELFHLQFSLLNEKFLQEIFAGFGSRAISRAAAAAAES